MTVRERLLSLMEGVEFCIDEPRGATLSSHVVRVSGWFLSRAGSPADSIRFLVDGEPSSSAMRSLRTDVAAAYPDKPLAANAGFVGDIVLEPSADPVELSFEARFGDELFETRLGKLALPAGFVAPAPNQRPRAYELDDLLSAAAKEAMLSKSRDVHFSVIAGVPHFHNQSDLPLIRLSETGQTHLYPDQTIKLIKALTPSQIFLDLGCGIRPFANIFENGIYLDAVHFPRTDIVSTTATLPFRDSSIDLVVSHAVFEHLRDPHKMAREIFRILKPGGAAYIDTAFMQPLHGDPSHYFNMTLNGLRTIFDGFEFIATGVAPWQAPSRGLRMQIESVSALIMSERWRQILDDLRRDLDVHGAELDASLGPIGREILAAGVFAHVRKPE